MKIRYGAEGLKTTEDNLAETVGSGFLSGLLQQYEIIFKNKNLSLNIKQNLVNSLDNLYTDISKNTIISDTERASILTKINSADLTSIVGIDSLINSLKTTLGYDNNNAIIQ